MMEDRQNRHYNLLKWFLLTVSKALPKMRLYTVWQHDSRFHQSCLQYSRGVSGNITNELSDGLLEWKVGPVSYYVSGREPKIIMLKLKECSLGSGKNNLIPVQRQCV